MVIFFRKFCSRLFFSQQESDQKGATLVEAAIAMPLYMMCILFIPAVIPFMFNMIGAHYASVVSLREVASGPSGNVNGTLEEHLFQILERNLQSFTTGIDIDNVKIQTIRFNEGSRQVSESNIHCLRNASCLIPRGGFVSISAQIRFIDMRFIGLPDFSSRTLAVMKMNNFER